VKGLVFYRYEAGPQLKNTPWWGKIFKGRRQTNVWKGQKYTKHNKINNSSENFKG